MYTSPTRITCYNMCTHDYGKKRNFYILVMHISGCRARWYVREDIFLIAIAILHLLNSKTINLYTRKTRSNT